MRGFRNYHLQAVASPENVVILPESQKMPSSFLLRSESRIYASRFRESDKVEESERVRMVVIYWSVVA